MDKGVVAQIQAPSMLPVWPGVRQVAFLFLTEDGLDFEERPRVPLAAEPGLVGQVLRGSQLVPGLFPGLLHSTRSGAYAIYLHRARRDVKTFGFGGWGVPWSATPLSRWGAVELPHVETRWCALFGVEVALLARALEDPHNQRPGEGNTKHERLRQFVFVSHNTVPLKSPLEC